MSESVRVRFAPSPTGPLHIGGVRTALYNYLFARKMGGTFILRIEDTDQNRYVSGAEKYIQDALEWLGLNPDEGPQQGGDFGPYRQSERKQLYEKYAYELIEKGLAYFAFDTPEELEEMRKREAERGVHSAKYDSSTRLSMKNSLTLSEDETKHYLEKKDNVVVRLLIPENEVISFTDIVRDEVSFNSSELDDKVILKKDGMPTYHLANIVDDHLMKITHVIRGEEWLSSTAHHVLMYKYFGWEAPKFTHLPLILKPSGKGKLSKRDGAKFGFPVFPLEWVAEEETYQGFKESGFDPKALINFLVLLGWNPGNDEEIMDVERMTDLFSLDKIIKSGARFDIDKAHWFNQQYIMSSTSEELLPDVKSSLDEYLDYPPSDEYLITVINLMKERVQDFKGFFTEGEFFFRAPHTYDEKQVKKRYQADQNSNFETIVKIIEDNIESSEDLGDVVKNFLSENELKMGIYLPLLRIMLCGSLKGPDLFDIIKTIGASEAKERIESALKHFESLA